MNHDELLRKLVKEGASDIHFKVGRSPLLRINGVLKAVSAPSLQPQDTEEIARFLLGSEQWEKFSKQLEIDTSYSIRSFCRFRVNVFRQRGSVSITMRVIPFKIPSLDELGVPEIVKKLALSQRGLVLVTGITGSGKSSTLAGMIEFINTRSNCHIITIEDPIEFLHSDKMASINQREIGVDTDTFPTAFRSALRQDPDIIMVGELRDTSTMEIALRAAETGHLVLSTVHTTDAKETIGRFIDSFPPHQQKQVRIQLAANLNAVISQRLLRRADDNGLILAAEVMVVNAAIKDFIIDPARISDIVDNMAKGRDQYGSQTFDQALMDLLNLGLVSEQEAVVNATSPNDLKLKLSLK
ncbi:MAG: type IV pilus twitching motility protein PilT [Chitinispirillaceae bacterium]